MRKTWLLGLGGGLILLVGVLAGTIFGDNLRALAAGDPANGVSKQTRADYCTLYEQTLASDLKVSSADLQAAQKAAAQKVIDQMAADGKITADQKTKLEAELQKDGGKACAFAPGVRGGPGRGQRGDLLKQLQASRTAIETAVAAKLNISASTLDGDLAAGKTIPQIAQTQKVAIADVNTAYLTAVKAQLDTLVSGGKLTADQETKLYQRVQQAVQAGHYPLLNAKPAK